MGKGNFGKGSVYDLNFVYVNGLEKLSEKELNNMISEYSARNLILCTFSV